ncbi:hypothetical protein Tco_0948961 [Tanacetum coccineum]
MELDLFGILLGEWEEGQALHKASVVGVSFGTVMHNALSPHHRQDQETITRSRLLSVTGPVCFCILSAFLTQGTVSNIPIVFSWSDGIRPEGFVSSVLLWLVIIVTVVGVGVTIVVVVVESSSVIKISFVIT